MSEKPTDNNEPDPFADFDDWNILNSDVGSIANLIGNELTKVQESIIQCNINLSQSKEAWYKKVDAFEVELDKITNEEKRDITRNQFIIRFNHHNFTEGQHQSFLSYRFPCPVDFSNVNFGQKAINFSSAKFWGNVNFNHAKMCDAGIFFNDAKFFKGDVTFNNVDFCNGDISFNNTNFYDGGISFKNSTFGKGSISFAESKFDKERTCNINFDKSRFNNSKKISFARAKLKGDFRFTPDKENSTIENANFDDLEVGGNLTINANFEGAATFQRLDVKGSADFSGCKFKQVPDFRDMKLDRPPEVAGMKVPPEKLKMGFNPLAKYSGDKDDVTKYRKLKSMAIAASDHVKSGEFFAYEMMAKRGIETIDFIPLLFNYLYGLFSGYGQSYKRPVAWLTASWIFFACINIWKIFQELVFVSELDFWKNIGLSFTLSARNLIPFFNSLSRFAPAPKDHVSWFQKSMNRLETEGVNIDLLTVSGIVEQLIGAILLFLLLLGLRNKFRLK